ncbi:MAG: ABC transporter permease, partial [Alphaproteobacteria bacterium]
MSELSLRHALRDMRRGLRHLRLLAACLILSVAVMSGIGLVVANIKAGIARDASSLLGGDMEVRQLYQPLTLKADSYLLFNSKSLSRTMDMRAMAITDARQTLVEFKAVDTQYPLIGELTYKQELDRKTVRAERRKHKDHVYEAAVDQSFLDIMDMQLGSTFAIGDANFIASRLIQSEPDRSFSTMTLGPRVMVNHHAFRATGLLQYGSMVYYSTRILLKPEKTSTQIKQELETMFPDALWRVRDFSDSAPGLISLIDRLSLFFALTAITALMVAGIGIANATNIYLWSKRSTIALMKCLGASSRHVVQVYLLQILIISVASITLGCLLGIGAEVLLLEWISGLLKVQSVQLFYGKPILLSAALALLTVLLFSVLPLARTRHIKPAALLRGHSEISSTAGSLPAPVWGMMAVLLVMLVALAVLFTSTVQITLFFAVGLILAMSLLYGLGCGLQTAARKIAHRGKISVRSSIILANLARPGAPTRSMVVALGVSMSLIIALVQVAGNLRAQIEQGLPEHAPSFFLADIQPSQLGPLVDALNRVPGAKDISSLPMSRGRIVQLNGVPVAKAQVDEKAQWATRSERGLTESAKPPEGSVIVDGTWWPEHYAGAPLVSFDRKLAEGMGLAIGDTITIATIDKRITATIASLRDIQWGSLEMNFAIILSPGSLRGLPTTYLTTVNLPPESEKQVQQMLAGEYSNVVAVRVREVLGQV